MASPILLFELSRAVLQHRKLTEQQILIGLLRGDGCVGLGLGGLSGGQRCGCGGHESRALAPSQCRLGDQRLSLVAVCLSLLQRATQPAADLSEGTETVEQARVCTITREKQGDTEAGASGSIEGRCDLAGTGG